MKELRFCIDRVEGDIAVLIDPNGQAYQLPHATLPEGTGEQDVLFGTLKNGVPTALRPCTGTDPVQQKIAALHQKLFASSDEVPSDTQTHQK